MKGRRRYATVFALVAAASGAQAQDTQQTADGGALRARQLALNEAMLRSPDDLELMFEHAMLSIDLRDYEAAITTLERMLIFNPKLSRAKVELGAAYFRLGAYENARYYFEDVLENDGPPPEVERRISAFLEEIDRRTRKSGFSGIVSVGATYSSNANLGPPDAGVLVFDTPAVLNNEFVEADDVGFRFVAQGRHFYDLGRPNNDAWLTDVSVFSLNYLDETRGDIDSVSVQTGPRLSLDEFSYGPKLRPYLSAELLTSGNDVLYYAAGAGVEYTDTFSDTLNLYAAYAGEWREYEDRNEFDGHSHRVAFGVAYAPSANTALTALAYGETDQADADFNKNYEAGLRLGFQHRYDSGFAFTERLWNVGGFASVSGRWLEEANPAVSAGRTRSDLDLRAGLSHIFHFTGGVFVQVEADYLYRESNLPNFDLENLGAAISVGLTF